MLPVPDTAMDWPLVCTLSGVATGTFGQVKPVLPIGLPGVTPAVASACAE